MRSITQVPLFNAFNTITYNNNTFVSCVNQRWIFTYNLQLACWIKGESLAYEQQVILGESSPMRQKWIQDERLRSRFWLIGAHVMWHRVIPGKQAWWRQGSQGVVLGWVLAWIPYALIQDVHVGFKLGVIVQLMIYQKLDAGRASCIGEYDIVWRVYKSKEQWKKKRI
jgi:hypothetical protein